MSVTLITGGAGFIGTNLADHILARGGRVRILDNLSRAGVERNLAWLTQRHGSLLEVEVGDVRERERVAAAVRGAERVFHFAAQVAVTTSFDQPLTDLAVNVQGTANVLEAARSRPHPPSIVFTSTNKVYGGLDDVQLRAGELRYRPLNEPLRSNGIAESQPLRFCTPYGCSKGAADQYVLDWSRSFHVPSVVLRMSCIYGPHQLGTEDQGWVAHFLIRALERKPITIYGDGKQVRDILYVEDLVAALVRVQERAHALSGSAFNIGGGAENALSLRELLELITTLCGRRPAIERGVWREGDQRYYVSDHRLLTRAIGWQPQVGAREGVSALYEWLAAQADTSPVAA